MVCWIRLFTLTFAVWIQRHSLGTYVRAPAPLPLWIYTGVLFDSKPVFNLFLKTAYCAFPAFVFFMYKFNPNLTCVIEEFEIANHQEKISWQQITNTENEVSSGDTVLLFGHYRGNWVFPILYHPHPKDGEGNIFSLCVSLHPGRGNHHRQIGGSPIQSWPHQERGTPVCQWGVPHAVLTLEGCLHPSQWGTPSLPPSFLMGVLHGTLIGTG